MQLIHQKCAAFTILSLFIKNWQRVYYILYRNTVAELYVHSPLPQYYFSQGITLINFFPRYSMMTVREIVEHPVGDLLHDGALLVIWCTNNSSLIQELVQALCVWDVQLVAT